MPLLPLKPLTKTMSQNNPPPADVVDMETKEVTEVAQLKRKNKEKEQEKKGGKGKETSA